MSTDGFCVQLGSAGPILLAEGRVGLQLQCLGLLFVASLGHDVYQRPRR